MSGGCGFHLLAQAATGSCARKGVGRWGGRMSGGCGFHLLAQAATGRRLVRQNEGALGVRLSWGCGFHLLAQAATGVAAPARAWGVWV